MLTNNVLLAHFAAPFLLCPFTVSCAFLLRDFLGTVGIKNVLLGRATHSSSSWELYALIFLPVCNKFPHEYQGAGFNI